MSTSRRGDVLAALRAADGGIVSGESLAAGLGVSRVAIAKHVRHLRERGYEILSVPGQGYRLVASPDVLTDDDLESRVASSLVSRVSVATVTGSTNDDAKKLAAAGVSEIAVVVASQQTAGRGRLGRVWESPAGGVYVSFLFRPTLPVAGLSPLPLVVGLGAARGLERLGADVRLKWPNDLVLDGGKLAGVLLEMAAEADRAQWVVAGIGLNVRRAPMAAGAASGAATGAAAGLATSAAYLEDALPGIDLADVAAAVIDGVAETYAAFVKSGFVALRADYEHRHMLAGREASVTDAVGERIAEGRVDGVDDSGRLLVRSPQGLVAVIAGDVTLRRR